MSKLIIFLLAIMLCAAAAVGGPQTRPAPKAPIRPDLAVPNLLPGDSVSRAKQIFGEPGMRQERAGLRYYQWWLADMNLWLWADQGDTIQAVTVQFKRIPILTSENVSLGRDSLATLERKLGSKVLKRRTEPYIVDVDCWGADMTLEGDAAKTWVVRYQTIACRRGDFSADALRSRPLNNMRRQKQDFKDPDEK